MGTVSHGKGTVVFLGNFLFVNLTWRKAYRKTGKLIKHATGRLRARLIGTNVTDSDLLRSLDRQFNTPDAFLDHMANRTTPRFFFDSNQRQELLASFQTLCPRGKVLTVEAADRICDHVFDLLGSGLTHLSERIDWHTDFKTGHCLDSNQYYADVRPASYPGGYDIKVPWELSRCQHFVWLGQAYWFSNDEKYACEFVSQVLDWIAHNPPQFGVNWACTMDVAIRAVSWLWGYYFFKDSTALCAEFRLAFFKNLLSHGRHIIDNLEWSETLTANHYLSDIVGLVYLGILMPEFKEASRWREFGLQELEREMFKQVYPDGVDFEASVSYHRLVAELFLSATILAQVNGHIFSQAYLQRLEKMLEFTMFVTKPDGTVPLIGDNDNGRLHRLKVWGEPKQEWLDHRCLLAIGAVIFSREDFAQAAGDQWEEATWLVRKKALAFKRTVEDKGLPRLRLKSRRFLDAGIYIMRHDDFYMAVDAGPNGQNGNGGHAHNDTLSFEFYAYGYLWLIDPGTFAYTSDYEARNHFRSIQAHNTISVNCQEQSLFDPERLFSLQSKQAPKILDWTNKSSEASLTAEYSADSGWTHRRHFHADFLQREVTITDSVTTIAPSRILEVYFHIAPSITVLCLDNNKAILQSPDGTRLVLRNTSSQIGQFSQKLDWVSLSYGTKQQASVICYTIEIDNFRDATLIWKLTFQGKALAENQNQIQFPVCSS